MHRQRTLAAVGGGWLVVVGMLALGCAGDPSGFPSPTDARANGDADGGLDRAVLDVPGGGMSDVAAEAVADASSAPGFKVTAASGLKTTERGGQATFTVALLAPPTAVVSVALISDRTGEGTVSPAGLMFTPVNWNAPQTVTVTGVDDPNTDGDVSYSILLAPATSADTAYQGLDPDDVMLTNSDDETAGIAVATMSPIPATTEAGGQATFTVVLESRPTATVTVPVVTGDATEGKVTPASVTFTTDNWNAPQTVTVTGVDDPEADGNTAYIVKVGPPTGADAKYAALPFVEVPLTNTDNETAGVTLTPPMSPVTTEAGGMATSRLVLNSKPTATVTFVFGSSDTTEGTVAPASVVFTPDNWNAPRNVIVTGVDDTLADGNQPYTDQRLARLQPGSQLQRPRRPGRRLHQHRQRHGRHHRQSAGGDGQPPARRGGRSPSASS